MSFFTVHCPWCGETYTAGIVGTQPIGTGHDCKGNVACNTEGCDSWSEWQVKDLEDVEGPGHLVCTRHIGDRALHMAHTPPT